MTKVFLVILNWNGYKDTLECLGSVSKVKPDNYDLHVVIVDNASTDNSVNYVKNFKSDNFEFSILTNKKNIGFAAGNNVGIKYSLEKGADYVMILNNDTIIDKNLISGLLRTFREDPEVGVVSPKIYFAPGFEFHKKVYQSKDLGKVIWYAGGDMNWRNIYGTNHGVDEVDRRQFEKTIATDFVTGACAFFNAEALKDIGFFDEKYFLYLEDADISQRMRKGGWKVLYSPHGFLWHKVAQSSAIGSELNDYFITRNRILFGLKYAPLRTRGALVRESIKLLVNGRKWQKIGIKDYYLGKFYQGSWRN
ncbi:hypothetical protein A2V55_02310 [Candidatus Woesebacteria bacterium RBG_19FT_COMBO_37_29]|uniref:Glycosyltransferase 2-like domain-containing protein n=1 Tax=Candidatus Woesebacteria bacterium RBG_19FT_COMBO_37_29 TaxID=1802486 RepID=A0A1F7XPG4_9BACT|nr:MAG: hypothetical protein A2V55_02310 [Candidatus Woesebacteria bacterium RBG_19FT_COMBO_37_29]